MSSPANVQLIKVNRVKNTSRTNNKALPLQLLANEALPALNNQVRLHLVPSPIPLPSPIALTPDFDQEPQSQPQPRQHLPHQSKHLPPA
jgi:hypothetical protein